MSSRPRYRARVSETVAVALIAVLGTSVGAAISPLISAIKEVLAANANSRSDRLRTAADLASALLTLGQRSPDKFDGPAVRAAHNAALDLRFRLASQLVRGEGTVDEFVERAIAAISANAGPARVMAAEYAASRLLAWARKDLRASDLRRFKVYTDGEDSHIVL